MFRIKICGVTCVRDAMLVARSGADALGLNFYPSSRRYVTEDQAEQICHCLPAEIARVGVFVNASVGQMCDLAEHLRLDWLQLHGDESPEIIASLAPRRVLRAFRPSQPDWQQQIEYLEICRTQSSLPGAVLIDAYDPREYGGTGKTADWSTVPAFQCQIAPIPIVLAGGLRADNVGAAILAARPAAVDTASGVEFHPGRKDAERVQAFVDAARNAWREVDG
jgi:phosphoribosylanthranilate isomerase